MRVALIVVVKRNSQTRERYCYITLVHIGDVIVLDGLHERLGHAIALRRTYRRGQRLKAQFSSEAARAVWLITAHRSVPDYAAALTLNRN